MREKLKIHSRADFINLPFHGEDGSIFSEIVMYKGKEGKFISNWDATLKLRDCSSVVSFDLWLKNEEDIENTLHKLQVMIDHLTELREKIKQYGPEYVKTSKKDDNE
jgi:hypothetical protein